MKTQIATEKQFQAAVVRLAKMTGWLVYFTQRSDRSPAGFPDLILARNGTLIAWELKRSAKSRPTPQQRAWLAALAECGIESRVVTPDDWQHIEITLAALPRTGGG